MDLTQDLQKTKEEIRRIIFDVILENLLGRILAVLPILNWPVIKPLFQFIITQLAKVFYDQTSLLITNFIIEATVNSQVQAAKTAANKLDSAIKSESPEEIKRAEDEFKKRYSDLIRFN